MHTKRMTAAALASVGLAAASLGLGVGTAQAIPSQPHQWCPGTPMHNPPGPGAMFQWDMNVCHTWQYVKPGMGNVPSKTWDYASFDPVTQLPTSYYFTVENSIVWEGPNMPPGAEMDCSGRDMFTGIPIPC